MTKYILFYIILLQQTFFSDSSLKFNNFYIPNGSQACKILGGNFIDDLCIYDDILTCISYNHRSIFDYNQNCSFFDYYSDLCLPKQNILKYWCPQYPNCLHNSDCLLTNNCITKFNINKCLFNNRQPYCIMIRNQYSIIECD